MILFCWNNSFLTCCVTEIEKCFDVFGHSSISFLTNIVTGKKKNVFQFESHFFHLLFYWKLKLFLKTFVFWLSLLIRMIFFSFTWSLKWHCWIISFLTCSVTENGIKVILFLLDFETLVFSIHLLCNWKRE